jgi:hypothetical protein
VSERAEELYAFYREHRINDQLRFYTERRTLFDRAAGQATALAAILLGGATAAGALSGTVLGPRWLWSVLAVVLPAAAAAVTGYSTLYTFEQQSKIYADAIRAVRAAARTGPAISGAERPTEENASDWVRRSEAVFRQEQAQWGQLTSQIRNPDTTPGA